MKAHALRQFGGDLRQRQAVADAVETFPDGGTVDGVVGGGIEIAGEKVLGLLGVSGLRRIGPEHRRGIADLDAVLKKLNYDFFYISRCTLWIDVLILLRTIKTMLTGFGSR